MSLPVRGNVPAVARRAHWKAIATARKRRFLRKKARSILDAAPEARSRGAARLTNYWNAVKWPVSPAVTPPSPEEVLALIEANLPRVILRRTWYILTARTL